MKRPAWRLKIKLAELQGWKVEFPQMQNIWDLTAAQRSFLLGPEKEEKAEKKRRVLSMTEMENMTRNAIGAGLILAED